MNQITCAYTIEGPKIDARGNVAWRRGCKRVVKRLGDYCWQHSRSHNV